VSNEDRATAEAIGAAVELELEPEGAEVDLFEILPSGEAPQRIEGVVLGIVAGLSPTGAPVVELPQDGAGLRRVARSTTPLGEADIGREVALLFEGGDPARPIVIGLLQRALPRLAPAVEPVSVARDGERLVLTAEKEIELRCGEASITLTRAGKVIIRGAYVLTRSSGVNRILGGSVQIN
jgi:hypothetical protein